MTTPKRKLTREQKAGKKKRREEYMTVFVNGKQKRVNRPPTIDAFQLKSSSSETQIPFGYIRMKCGNTYISMKTRIIPFLMMERFHFKQMITSGFSRTSLRSSAEPRRSLKGFEMLNLKLTVVTLTLVGCFLITGCKDRESNPEQITDTEQISEFKSRKDVPELIKIFVREGINYQETNMESDTMPPVVPHADSHLIEWSRALFTPALKALIDIGEPSVPSLLRRIPE